MLPFNIGPGELILILVIALVVLGPGKLPDVASSLGKSVREFRKAATDINDAGKLDDTPVTTPASSSRTASGTPGAVAPGSAPAIATMPDAPPPRSDDPGTTARGTGAPARDPNAS